MENSLGVMCRVMGQFIAMCAVLIIRQVIRPLKFESVLNDGCRQGSFLAELKLDFPHIVPNRIDISSSALALARQRLPDGNFWALDISEKSLDEKCALVVCSELLEHIPDDVSAIQNLRKMTKNYLLVSTPQGQMRQFERQIGQISEVPPIFWTGR